MSLARADASFFLRCVRFEVLAASKDQFFHLRRRLTLSFVLNAPVPTQSLLAVLLWRLDRLLRLLLPLAGKRFELPIAVESNLALAVITIVVISADLFELLKATTVGQALLSETFHKAAVLV